MTDKEWLAGLSFHCLDDILLITPSICTLEKLLRLCEREVNLLDMVINAKNRAV